MNRLLFWTNLMMFLLTILGCPVNQKNQEVKEEAHHTSATDTIIGDSLVTVMDSVSGQSVDEKPDSLSKEEKYAKGSGAKREAPQHQTPNETKLDSIKNLRKKNEKSRDRSRPVPTPHISFFMFRHRCSL